MPVNAKATFPQIIDKTNSGKSFQQGDIITCQNSRCLTGSNLNETLFNNKEKLNFLIADTYDQEKNDFDTVEIPLNPEKDNLLGTNFVEAEEGLYYTKNTNESIRFFNVLFKNVKKSNLILLIQLKEIS